MRSLNNYHPYGSLIDAGSWSGSSYNFGYNGMLKEEIGKDISHTHFRNLSSITGRWWSPDPLESSFPGRSSYVSMGNNPISRIDPLGDDDYQVDRQGHISLIGEPNDDTKDVLFAHNKDGKRDVNNFLELDKGILDKIETKQTVGVDDKNMHKNYDILQIDDIKHSLNQSSSLFTFLANNSNVEWSLLKISDADGRQSSILSTSFKVDREFGVLDYAEYELSNTNIVLSHVHSHPPKDNVIYKYHLYPSGIEGINGIDGTYGDIKAVNWFRLNKNAKNATFYIYVPNVKSFKYDEKMTKEEYEKANDIKP